MKTKEIFCTNEQKITKHTLTVDNNGEILATCECERFIKFPAGLTANGVEKLIAIHLTNNKLSEEALEIENARKESEELLDEIAD